MWQMCFGFCMFTGMKMSAVEETQSHVNPLNYIPPYTSLHNQVSMPHATKAILFKVICNDCKYLKSCWIWIVGYVHIHIQEHVIAALLYWPSLWSCLRYLLICFLRRQETGGITHCQNNDLFHLHLQRCSTVSVTSHRRSVGLGPAHTQKTVWCAYTHITHFRGWT